MNTRHPDTTSQADFVQANFDRPSVLREYRDTIERRQVAALNYGERLALQKQLDSFDADLKARGITL